MTDLSYLTKSMFDKSVREEVLVQVPLLAMLESHSRVSFNGGVDLKYTIINVTAESLMQMYAGSNTTLDTASKAFTAQADFHWKTGTIPAVITGEEQMQNIDAADENKIADIAEIVVKQVQLGARLALNTQFHATTAVGDDAANFQGIPEALAHGTATYGGIAKATSGTGKVWAGASLLNNYADVATSTGLSLDVLRRMKYACTRYGLSNGRRFYLFTGEANFSRLIGLAEVAKVPVTSGRLAKFGIEAVEIYGIEVVCDSYMTDNSMTTHTFMLDPETWDFRLHPKRSFTLGKFVNQADFEGGTDKLLARCMVAGALICKQPNGNMYKSAVS